jgi:co-chaperonin GroES (HSP10)
MIKPNEEFIFVQAVSAEEVTEGGILVSVAIAKGLPRFKVVMVAENPKYNVGDIILAKPNTGWDHEENKEKYKVLRFDDVIAIVTEEPMTM